MVHFKREDVAELIIGACVLAFPVAVTEEVWDISKQISFMQATLIALFSCGFLSVFIYYIHGRIGDTASRRLDVRRIVTTYCITLLVCAAILAMLGKFPLFTDTAVALKRVVLVAFPACFSATVVDSLR